MKKVFFNHGLIKLEMVEFDTQDNLVKLDSVWKQNLDLNNNFKPLEKFGLRRFSDTEMWFKSEESVSMIRLNNFPYSYKIKKVSNREFIIKSKKLQNYFDGTDNVTIIVKKN